MPKPTTYGGQTVNAEEKNMIQTQPIADFLRFEQNGDDRYVMKYRMPETGMDQNGNIVNIRKNMNLIFKSLAKQFIDENGAIRTEPIQKDPEQEDLIFLLTEASSEDAAKALGIEEKDKDDFIKFVDALAQEKGVGRTPILKIVHEFRDMFQNIAKYSALIEAYEYFDGINFEEYIKFDENEVKSKEDEEEKRRIAVEKKKKALKFHLEDSYDDYRNMLQDLKDMANMDAENEMEFKGFLDCLNSSFYNEAFSSLVGRKYGVEPIGRKYDIEMKSNDENRVAKFEVHACFIAPIVLHEGEAPQLLSIETTATPAHKYVFRDPNGRTATGIYEDEEALVKFHKDNNDAPEYDQAEFDESKNQDQDSIYFNIAANQQVIIESSDLIKYGDQLQDKINEQQKKLKKLKGLNAELIAGKTAVNSSEYGDLVDGIDEVLKIYAKYRPDKVMDEQVFEEGFRKIGRLAEAYINHKGNNIKDNARGKYNAALAIDELCKEDDTWVLFEKDTARTEESRDRGKSVKISFDELVNDEKEKADDNKTKVPTAKSVKLDKGKSMG